VYIVVFVIITELSATQFQLRRHAIVRTDATVPNRTYPYIPVAVVSRTVLYSLLDRLKHRQIAAWPGG